MKQLRTLCCLVRLAMICVAICGSTVIFLTACNRGGRSHHSNVLAKAGTLIPVSGAHVGIYLRDINGLPINIETETTPYSPDYSVIEEGFHFQQGADFLDDNYGVSQGGHSWVLSPGMVGKW